MKNKNYFLLIILLLNLTGCAFLETSEKRANININKLIKENEFAAAISYMDNLPDPISNKKKIKKNRTRIIKSMHAYEEKTLARINSFVEKSNWKAVIDIFSVALQKLPEESVVFREYKTFKETRNRHIYELEIQALVVRGNSLEKIVELSHSILESDPYNSSKKRKLYLSTSEAKNIAEELLEHGIKAIENNEISIAKRTLPLALRLYKSKEIEIANKQLEKLSKSMSEPLQDLINKGAELYGQEHYEEAIIIWQQVLLLDPENNDIKSNLERTQRVIENLKRLKKSNKESKK
ncbi:MAG: hypothetical protein OEY06_05315 [Gammaproteobacteria bacterium]|nr:hypothetical protein [Gammaproteobacteria bacterium]